MIVDTDSHLREAYFLDEVYRLEAPFAQFTPVRIEDGEPYQRRFSTQFADRGSPPSYNHSYMYDPTVAWRGGEIARRQVGGYDMERRLADNAVEGVDRQLIFPTGISLPATTEGELGAALCRAYNDWVARLVHGHEDQLLPVAIMPAGHPPAMAGELRRCVRELGFKAAHLVPYCGDRNLHHEDFYPFYEMAQELEVPLLCHPNGHLGPITERFDNFFTMHVLGRPTNCTQALVALVGGGVFELYPRLQVVFFEVSSEWPLYWMHRMDADFGWMSEVQDRHLKVRLSMTPSEYVRRHCWVTVEADEPNLRPAIDELGVGRLLMATDYPHFDSEFPRTVAGIRERSDISAKEKDLILGENAASLLRL